MIRTFCAVVLLSGITYGAFLPFQSPEPTMFPATCTENDVARISVCTETFNNQSMETLAVVNQFGQAILTGEITEDNAQILLDSVCERISSVVNCVKPFQERCFTSPLYGFSFHVYDTILQICEADHRDKYFTQLVTCNKKLDFLSTLTSDTGVATVIQDFAGMNISVVEIPTFVLVNYQCRLIERVHALLPMDKVTADCGAETYTTIQTLYPQLLAFAHCEGDHAVENNGTTSAPTATNTTIIVDINNSTNTPPAASNTTINTINNSTNSPNPGLPTSTVAPQWNTTAAPVLNNNTDAPIGSNNTGSYVQPGSGSVFYILFALIVAIVTAHVRS